MRRFLDREIPRRWVRLSLLGLAGLFCLLLGFSVAWLRHLSRDLPPLATIQTIEPSQKTLVLSAEGDTIHEFFRENRAFIPLDRLPRRLQQAVVAIEDRRFYDHYGVDARRLVKILWDNLTARGRPGASTLTMQLARNVFLASEMSEKTISRKIKEIILALQIEQTYAKDEILTMYLNQIYMGRGAHGAAYGMQSAARTYFGRDIWDCGDAELTLLAGIIQNPGRHSPYANPESAYRRRALVLQAMVETGALTESEADSLRETRVQLLDPDVARRDADFASYFVEEVRQHLERRYGVTALYEGGLRVTTTLVPRYQRWMEQALESHLAKCETDFGYQHTRARYQRRALAEDAAPPPDYLQGAALLLDSRTGAVLGLVGGRSFRESKWNRATQARRQTGSVIKPFVYLAALRRGYTPASILMDTPVVIDTGAGLWRPRSYTGEYLGPVTLRYALSHSLNMPTAKFYLDFGLQPLLAAAADLGVASELPRVPSLFLGAGETTLLEITAAFAPIGNEGIHAEPFLVQRVETPEGEVLEEAVIRQRDALDPAVAYVMANLLESTLTEGTAARARQYGFRGAAGGKTGTTNDCTDAWFVGFTPRLCAGVWVGFDAKIPMGRNKTGGVMAMPIWAEFMGRIAAEGPDEPFPRPAGVATAPVCQRTGLLATTRCDSVRTEVFVEGTEPRQLCDRHPGRPLRPGDVPDARPLEPAHDPEAVTGDEPPGLP